MSATTTRPSADPAASNVRNYALVTGAYWGFTVTDGAIHMLVLLHFYRLGYTPLQLAVLFVLYEVTGIVTNLVGGWIAARMGVRATLLAGLGLQVVALSMLSPVSDAWAPALSVAYVTFWLAMSGVAKDLTKMSSKSAIKLLVPGGSGSGTGNRLFKWVALLTGSKNALKGVGFFVGALLLAVLGYAGALIALAGCLLLILAGTALSLPGGMGRVKGKVRFTALFSGSRNINVLSFARVFLFGSRDVWFTIGMPLFLAAVLHWPFIWVGGFLALWVIGYGAVQSFAPQTLGLALRGRAPGGQAALGMAVALALLTAAIAWAYPRAASPATVVVAGLLLFGAIFALNSSLHSYLILAFTSEERAVLDVGFYYSANGVGRLTGTLLSGILYQWGGLAACLWTSAAFLAVTSMASAWLPAQPEHAPPLSALEGGE